MKNYFIMLFYILVFAGCSKEKDQGNQEKDKPVTPVLDGKKCEPLTIRHGDEIITYHYDSLGRVYFEEYDNLGTQRSNTYSYIYNNGKVSIIQFRTEWGDLISNFNVDYDSLDRIIKVTNGFRTYQISYDGSGRVQKYTESANGRWEREINYQYNGSQILLTYVYNTTTVQPNTDVYDFDTALNPISSTTPRALVIEGIYFKNNPVKITYGYSGHVFNITHKYNSSGYPESGTITYPVGDPKYLLYTYNCK
jgi:YD repeat-containing protein